MTIRRVKMKTIEFFKQSGSYLQKIVQSMVRYGHWYGAQYSVNALGNKICKTFMISRVEFKHNRKLSPHKMSGRILCLTLQVLF